MLPTALVPACRYFADLFGGQALAAPTRYALAPAVLPGTPRHYDFGAFGANRRESIEALYQSFNEAGEALGSDSARQAVVDEANLAFEHNIRVYSEEGALWSDLPTESPTWSPALRGPALRIGARTYSRW